LQKMNQTLKTLESNPNEILSRLKAEYKIKQAEKREEQKEILKENAQKIIDWQNNKEESLPRNIDTPYLRLTNENSTVETSKGSRVPIQSALILWNMIKSGKDVKGHNIDGNTVIGLNGALTIGCHKISKTEVERFGAVLDSLEVKV